jgi:hypothetical protein
MKLQMEAYFAKVDRRAQEKAEEKMERFRTPEPPQQQQDTASQPEKPASPETEENGVNH